MTQSKKIILGISSCLLGENVRFDGGHKRDAFILEKLNSFASFKSFCPEMSIGLGVPREPIRLVMNTSDGEYQNAIRVVGTKNPQLDVTDKLQSCAEQQQAWLHNLDGYILKKDSPSCGMDRVKYYKDGHPVRTGGVGIFAKTLMHNNPLLPVEEEGRLNDLRLRENFIQRVYIYHHWKLLTESSLNARALVNFHSRIKYVLMSRSQKLYKELGQKIANIPKDINNFSHQYILSVMSGLQKVASRKNHVNVLQHIQGYLKKNLDSEDKRGFVQVIGDYREGRVPLVVPLTLLQHYFRKYPDSYIANSWYVSLYPEELALRNSL